MTLKKKQWATLERRNRKDEKKHLLLSYSLTSEQTEKIRRIITRLTDKSSKKDDSSRNRPITFLNSTLM